jgi:O-antigen/teichoic acid export membrane protein
LLAQGLMRGHNKVLRAQAPEMILIPGLLLVSCGLLGLFAPASLTPHVAVRIYGAAVIVALLAGLCTLRASLPTLGRPEKKWLIVSLPFFVVLSSTAINAQFDILMVGASAGSAATGVYALATRLSAVPMIALTAISMPLSPMVAMTFTTGTTGETQRLTALSAMGGAIGTTVIAAALLLAAPVLTAAIGVEYTTGLGALTILCAGRVIEAWLGPGGTVLAMTEHAGLAGGSVAVGACVNVLLNLLLIGPFGIEGAALATASGQATKAVMMWLLARSRVGIRTSAVEASIMLARGELVRPSAARQPSRNNPGR